MQSTRNDLLLRFCNRSCSSFSSPCVPGMVVAIWLDRGSASPSVPGTHSRKLGSLLWSHPGHMAQQGGPWASPLLGHLTKSGHKKPAHYCSPLSD